MEVVKRECDVRLFSRLRVLLLVLLIGASFARAAPNPPQLAITHVAVIDSRANTPRFDQTVLIANGRIVAMGLVARIKPSKDARVIDATGKFLIPGLWDMHVHLAGLNADPAWSKQVLLPLLLANGVTGVRDMGGDLDVLLAWKREIESGTLLGPHIVASGPFLVSSGKKTPEQYPVTNTDEARAAVRGLKLRGADFVKIISLPSKEVFFAVADEAKKQGIPFAGTCRFRSASSRLPTAASAASSTFSTAPSRYRFLRKRTTCEAGWWLPKKREIRWPGSRLPTKPTRPIAKRRRTLCSRP